MIQEAYCSYKIGKLLLEKGYDGPVEQVYNEDGTGSTPTHIGNWRAKSKIPKITHQMAMAWLREVHNLYIDITFDSKDYYVVDIYDMVKTDDYGSPYHYPPTIANCKTYEEAVEAACAYVLKILI